MKQIECPLCASKKNTLLEIIDNKKLIKQYKSLTQVDFSYLINENLKYCECDKCRLRFFDPLITGDEAFYKSLQKFEWYYPDDKLEYQYAKDYIESGDTVLDVGSGKGAFSQYALEKSAKFIGLDFSENAKTLAQNNGVDVRLESITDFANNHPESVDVVTSFQVLEHVDNASEFIESKLKSLKVGGIMIIAVPSEESYLSSTTNGILNLPPHHVLRWPDESLRFIAGQYNLELINIFHETVQDVHKLDYLRVFVENCFLSPKLIDLGIKRRAIAKLSRLIARFLSCGFSENMRPLGHNVLAVYKKRDASK